MTRRNGLKAGWLNTSASLSPRKPMTNNELGIYSSFSLEKDLLMLLRL
ncbi:hypothetical protein MC7420_796 [Coleofasciculus chthonoplastes PCC 7420]|uniref:Uncharacterized protein n=1 Tax=Coleofasciculus chthonoplastes PCC 7420 TaxID=118168 RepID=B4VSV9_9CYAN|nr:hypothetical protein MC7420_796 [Coleofasciculus chthonoplastes PCC 7420]